MAAVLLGVVFLVTSGGGDIPAPRASQQQQQATAAAQRQLGDEQRKDLEQQLAGVQAQLAADSSDAEALEGAAVLNARLGNFADAEQQLVALSAAKPGNADVLRVLAESQAAQSEWAAAASSYKQAWEAGGKNSLEVLQGLAGGWASGWASGWLGWRVGEQVVGLAGGRVGGRVGTHQPGGLHACCCWPSSHSIKFSQNTSSHLPPALPPSLPACSRAVGRRQGGGSCAGRAGSGGGGRQQRHRRGGAAAAGGQDVCAVAGPCA